MVEMSTGRKIEACSTSRLLTRHFFHHKKGSLMHHSLLRVNVQENQQNFFPILSIHHKVSKGKE